MLFVIDSEFEWYRVLRRHQSRNANIARIHLHIVRISFLRKRLKMRCRFIFIVSISSEISHEDFLLFDKPGLFRWETISHLVFAKPELILDDGTVTIDLPNEVVRRGGRVTRFLLEHRRIRDPGHLDALLGDAHRVRRSADVRTVIHRFYVSQQQSVVISPSVFPRVIIHRLVFEIPFYLKRSLRNSLTSRVPVKKTES